MPYVITVTDFKFPYEIPLTKDMNAKASEQVNAIIDSRCRSLLRRVLGIAGFNELDAALSLDFVLPDDAPEKWLNLVNGHEYDIDGKAYVWDGIKELLVKYVYYYWNVQTVSYLSGVGQVKAEAKNAPGVNPTQELVETWLSFVNDYQGHSLMSEPVGLVYHVGIPQCSGYYVNYPGDNTNASLVQFLSQFPDIYTDCNLSPIFYEGITNQLGF